MSFHSDFNNLSLLPNDLKYIILDLVNYRDIFSLCNIDNSFKNFCTNMSSEVSSKKMLQFNRHGSLYVLGTYTDSDQSHIPKKIGTANNVLRVSCGYRCTTFIDTMENVYTFGANERGVLGVRDKAEKHFPVKITNLSNIIQVAHGNHPAHGGNVYRDTLFLDDTGGTFACGDVGFGLFAGKMYEAGVHMTPIRNTELNNVVYIACGDVHSVYVTEAGDVYGLGSNNHYQLALDVPDEISTATKIPGLSNIIQAACGSGHTICLDKQGNVFTFGSDSDSQVGRLPPIDVTDYRARKPLLNKYLKDIVQISCGKIHNACLTKDGQVYTFGYGAMGQLGYDIFRSRIPRIVDTLPKIVQVACGDYFTACLSEDGYVYVFGYKIYDLLGITDILNREKIIRIPHISNVKYIACGTSHMAFIV